MICEDLEAVEAQLPMVHTSPRRRRNGAESFMCGPAQLSVEGCWSERVAHLVGVFERIALAVKCCWHPWTARLSSGLHFWATLCFFCRQVLLAPLNCVVLKCGAPSNNLLVFICNQVLLAPLTCVVVKRVAPVNALVVSICSQVPLALLNCLVVNCAAPLHNLEVSICSKVPLAPLLRGCRVFCTSEQTCGFHLRLTGVGTSEERGFRVHCTSEQLCGSHLQ